MGAEARTLYMVRLGARACPLTHHFLGPSLQPEAALLPSKPCLVSACPGQGSPGPGRQRGELLMAACSLSSERCSCSGFLRNALVQPSTSAHRGECAPR